MIRRLALVLLLLASSARAYHASVPTLLGGNLFFQSINLDLDQVTGGDPQYGVGTPLDGGFALAATKKSLRALVDTGGRLLLWAPAHPADPPFCTTPVSGSPRGLVLNAAGSRAYVSDADGFVTVVDTAVPVPWGSACASQRIDLQAPGLRWIALHPSGTALYAATPTDLIAYVLKDGTRTSIGGAGGDGGVAISPDGTRVYIVDTQAHHTTVVNTQTNAVVTTVAYGSGAVVVNPTGNEWYVTDAHTTSFKAFVRAFKTSDNTLAWSAELPQSGMNSSTEPVGAMARNPQGTKLYVTRRLVNEVDVVKIATPPSVKAIPGAGFGWDGFGAFIGPDCVWGCCESPPS